MTRLEKAANLSIILVCSAVTFDVVNRNLSQRATVVRPQSAGYRSAEYKQGDTLDESLSSSVKGQRTLLLFVKSSCPYCTQSIPFYKRLASERPVVAPNTQLVGVCTDPSDACDAYFQQIEVRVHKTLRLEPGTSRVRGTPTLILVDESSKIQAVWMGLLNESSEENVLHTIGTS